MSLSVGVLVGLAEVAFTYGLTLFNSQWKALLPATLVAFFQMVMAAVLTDSLLAVLYGLLLIGLAVVVVKLVRVPLDRNFMQAFGTLIIGGGLAYLYSGWMALFVLNANDFRSVTYRLIIVVGVVAIFFIALLMAILLARVSRNGRRSLLWTWISVAAILSSVMVLGFARYQFTRPTIVVPPTPGGSRPNVLLVTLDTLRADYVGCYGHPWVETPTLDGLAGDGALFETAISQSPHTCPSHCTIMTSVYPFDHEGQNGRAMRGGLPTLADVLHANGYETTAFTSATTTRSINTGLNQGFQRYVDSLVPWSEWFSRDEFQQLILFYVLGIMEDSQISGKVVSDRALRWLDAQGEQPFFVWLHYFDPHVPYSAPAPFLGKYTGKVARPTPYSRQRERYGEDIHFVDYQLGRIIQALRDRGLYEQTMIVVASDHGEAFGETHGTITEVGHGHFLYSTTQHVPWIIKPAGNLPEPRRIPGVVELADVAPTVLGLLEIERPETFVGRALHDVVMGREEAILDRDALGFNLVEREVYKPSASGVFVEQISVRSGKWNYIMIPQTESVELYDIQKDPNERIDVADQHVEVVEEQAAIVLPHSRGDAPIEDPRQRLAPTLVRQLQSLGYLGGSAEEETPRQDPKSDESVGDETDPEGA